MTVLPDKYFKKLKQVMTSSIKKATLGYNDEITEIVESFTILGYYISVDQALQLIKIFPDKSCAAKDQSTLVLDELTNNALAVISLLDPSTIKDGKLWMEFLDFYVQMYRKLEKNNSKNNLTVINISATTDYVSPSGYIDKLMEPLSFFIEKLINLEATYGKLGNTDEQILETVLSNKDIFFEYSWYVDAEHHSHLYFPYFQRFFPFTEEFIRENSEMFLFEQIMVNPVVENNIELQRLAFEKIMPENIQEIANFATRGNWHIEYKIPEEKIQQILLKYNLK